MNITELFKLENIKFIFEQISTHDTSFTLSLIGVFLAIVTVFLAWKAIQTKPEQFNTFWRLMLILSLIGSILLPVGSQALIFLNLSHSIPIGFTSAKEISAQVAQNLINNRRVKWFVRLIPYNSKSTPELAVDRLTHIGRSDQRFTFVADYDELRGYTAEEALLKIGGTSNASHISAILFPAEDQPIIIPANARGLLQIVKELDDELVGKIPNYKSLQLDTNLNPEELRALVHNDNGIASWAWENYKDYYHHYCMLAQEFRKGNYTAKTFLGNIENDWHPLGFSHLLPKDRNDWQDDACNVRSQKEIIEKAQEFGSRVFLVKNLPLPDISGRILIDFKDPKYQIIPDLGLK